MAKKLLKALVGVGALAAAGKFGYDKYKETKQTFEEEEQASEEDAIRKYNVIFDKKVVEIEEQSFQGCELKAVGSKMILDLGMAVFDKDVYISFSSQASAVTIVLPEGVNVSCDITRTASTVRNFVENVEEDGIHTVYIIGKAVCSSVEVVPMNFYVDDDDDFEDTDIFEEEDGPETADKEQTEPKKEAKAEEKAEADKQPEAADIPIEDGDDLEIHEV